MMWVFSKGPNMVISARGSRVDAMIPILTGVTGRLVTDKTGIVGNIDIDLIFAPEDGVTPIATAESALHPRRSVSGLRFSPRTLERIGFEAGAGEGCEGVFGD